MKNLSIDEQKMREITSFYSLRNLLVVVGAVGSTAFTIGMRISNMKAELLRNAERIAAQEITSTNRVQEWSIWRKDYTFKLDQTRWIVDDHEGRINQLEK